MFVRFASADMSVKYDPKYTIDPRKYTKLGMSSA